MASLSLDCSACGKKFRVSFAVRPRQVTCPKCKTVVNTPSAGEIRATQALDASGAVSALPDNENGAKPQRKLPVLPLLPKTAESEFDGWTYDQEAEKAHNGLQKSDVMGIIWFGVVLLMLGFVVFRLVRPRLVGEGVMALGVLGVITAVVLLLKLKGKPDGTTCFQCQSLLSIFYTIPSERDCTAHNYTRGTSGNAYLLEEKPAKKVWEIRKKWRACKACKRFFLVEKESRTQIGETQADLDKREAIYSEKT